MGGLRLRFRHRARFLGGAAVLVVAAAALATVPPLRVGAVTTISVNTAQDAPDPTPNDSTCDTATTSAAAGECSLRAAVQTANHDGTATITLPSATFVLNAQPDGTEEDSGDLEVTGAVTINGQGQGSSVVDGNRTDRVFHVFKSGSTPSLALSGMTVQHGKLSSRLQCVSSGADGRGGGGILVQDGGTLSLSHITVDSNQTCLASGLGGPGAGAQGGGIEQLGAGSATITDSTVSNNKAMVGGGVSEALFGSRQVAGTVTITRSAVTANQAFDFAAGVDEDGGGTVTIRQSTVSNNNAHNDGSVPGFTTTSDAGAVIEDGGGTVDVEDSIVDGNTSDDQAAGVNEDGGGVLIVRRTTISNNTALDSAGGMYLDGGGTVTIDSVQVLNNHVTGAEPKHSNFSGSGGGINEDGGDEVTITNSRISGNTSAFAAGIYFDGGGTYSIAKTTIDGNTATALGDQAISEDGIGGGILNDGLGTAQVTNTTINGNKASRGGSGYVLPNLQFAGARAAARSQPQATIRGVQTLLNDTITDNTTSDPNGGGDIDNGLSALMMQLKNTIVAGGSPVNCVGKVTSQGHNLDSGSSCGFAAPGDMSNRDPQLQPLASNPPGGPPTRLQRQGSPVIDAASSDCPPPQTDERGVTRPQGPACDIGAVEFRAADIPTPTPSPTSTPTPTPSPTSTSTPTPTAAAAPITAPNTGGAPPQAAPLWMLGFGLAAIGFAVLLRRRRRSQLRGS
jgi:CSLREA domain-containing protein